MNEETLQDVQKEVLHETLSGLRNDDPSTAEECCVICLSEITEPCVAVPCSHRNFDFICLATWLQADTRCPLCKADLVEVRLDPAQGEENRKKYKVSDITGTDHQLLSQQAILPQDLRRQTGGPNRRRREQRLAAYGSQSAHPSEMETRAQNALRFRRKVYSQRLYSLHVGSSLSTRFREWTRDDIVEGSEMLGRARAWIRRELQVFRHVLSGGEGEDIDTAEDGRKRRRQKNAAFVLEYVVAVLKTVDLQASNGHAGALLADFIGRENAVLFLHELHNFLRSPYSVEEWDMHAQYREPLEHAGPRTELRSAHDRSDEVQAQHSRMVADRYRPHTSLRRQSSRIDVRSLGSRRGAPRGADR